MRCDAMRRDAMGVTVLSAQRGLQRPWTYFRAVDQAPGMRRIGRAIWARLVGYSTAEVRQRCVVLLASW
jgi:hypothetical protein